MRLGEARGVGERLPPRSPSTRVSRGRGNGAAARFVARSPACVPSLVARRSIHIEGMELGIKRHVLFERQAVGGDYSAGYDMVGEGSVRTVFTPKGSEQGGADDYIVDERELTVGI